MRRAVFIIPLLLMSALLVTLTTEDCEGIGPVVSFGMIVSYDYPGATDDDPVDLSTGVYGNDEGDPIEPRWIVIDGEYEVTSQIAHYVQDVRVILNATFISSEFGVIDANIYFEPEVLVFSRIGPGQNQSQNFTLNVYLDEYIPAGDNSIEVGGAWQNDPGLLGGEIPLISTLPVHILPVTSAYFWEEGYDVILDADDHSWARSFISPNGNDYNPSLALRLDGDATNIGVEITYSFTSDVTWNEKTAIVSLNFYSDDAISGTSTEVTLVLLDIENDRELDSQVISIEIEEGYIPPPPDDGDDGDPPVVDDLWPSEECERTYSDENGDDLSYWSYIDIALNFASGIDLGQNPAVDIREVRSFRNNDNLVVEIEMYGQPEMGVQDSGIWNPYVYFLDPKSDHSQPVPQFENLEDTSYQDYQPSEAAISNSIFHSSRLWKPIIEVVGNKYVIEGPIISLMESGLNSDFQIFVKVKYNDFTEDESVEEDSLDVRTTYDFAGEGAWVVDPALVPEENLIDQKLININFRRILLVFVAFIIGVILLVISIVVLVSLAKKKR
jgi:hypothetical protein